MIYAYNNGVFTEIEDPIKWEDNGDYEKTIKAAGYGRMSMLGDPEGYGVDVYHKTDIDNPEYRVSVNTPYTCRDVIVRDALQLALLLKELWAVIQIGEWDKAE